ncbi:phage head closure protein [Ralstonia chuxiongensis]|uniref:Phage head closure protein n=1 Tax=Ralstonia chuxiongensis TaxID=2957504 RepID=A0AA42BKM2_9RALS|nr:phage head closure protein [Ralstonia chuxiongensis]MCP1173027.1 phage head closure protein [Ralstonia chuxiongensis]
MDFGRNSRRIELQRRVKGRTPSGQPTDTWETVARPWARPLGQSGREVIAAGRETATRQLSLRIRYRTDVTATWRVIYRGKPADIQAVLPDEINREHVDLVVALGASEG